MIIVSQGFNHQRKLNGRMHYFQWKRPMVRYLRTSTFAISVLLIVGCNKDEGVMPKIEGNRQQQAPKVEDKAPEPSQTERDTYMKNAREEIDQLRKQIDALSEKAKNSSADLKAKWEAKRVDLQEDLQVVEKKWQDLKDASSSAWKDMMQSLNESIEKLRKSIQKEDS
ncbi:MAG: sll1863 family stress response protein [Burkholderiaceae bacterium]